MIGPLSMLRVHPLEHLNLKILALALAIVLWSLVPDTSVPHIVRGVPVLLENIPTELALAEPFNATVDVLVTGTVLRTRDILPGELSPRLDMFGAFAGDNVITLAPGDIPTRLGVSVDRIQPAQVRIMLDDRLVAELPVSPVVEGTPAEGFDLYEATAEPASVRVSGPRSAIEGLSSVPTEVISVAGRSETLTRSVAVVADNPVVSVEGSPTVQLTLTIEEVAITSQIEGVSVTVVNATRRVVVNPELIGVVLRGPPSVLRSLTPENILATIDAGGLEPRADDYRVVPDIEIVPETVARRVEVIAITPQRRIDVHVFDQPAERR
jgi:hypothetical protein